MAQQTSTAESNGGETQEQGGQGRGRQQTDGRQSQLAVARTGRCRGQKSPVRGKATKAGGWTGTGTGETGIKPSRSAPNHGRCGRAPTDRNGLGSLEGGV
jgi:hypothetical protein